MNTFTASNGIQIADHRFGKAILDEDGTNRLASAFDFLNPNDIDALREFFRAEEDERLGRWRWPEDPDYVVYPKPDDAFARMFGPDLDLVILRESDGMTESYVRSVDQGGEPMAHRVGHILAARAYFDAHPEPKPAWHDAQPGEVWALKIAGSEEIAMRAVDAGHTRFWPIDGPEDAMTYGARSHAITAGRRIWPEVAS